MLRCRGRYMDMRSMLGAGLRVLIDAELGVHDGYFEIPYCPPTGVSFLSNNNDDRRPHQVHGGISSSEDASVVESRPRPSTSPPHGRPHPRTARSTFRKQPQRSRPHSPSASIVRRQSRVPPQQRHSTRLTQYEHHDLCFCRRVRL